MWSEHCSYKSSRVHLKTLPTTGKRVLQGPGENAGAVDIGDGLAAVFKIESHNHPSFIEPYQGAATGVGGIIRDIFTMGARPIALLNSLRFGSLDDPLVRRTMAGVVAGIAGYGNSIGIPTVGGEIAFDESYTGNPLVNVFCLGISRADEIIKGVASGAGNAVYYVGAKTGRDGIHGATMASAEFDDKSGGKASGGAGRRSVHGEAAPRSLPRGHEDRRARRHSGHGRGGSDLLDVRDGIARRRRRRDRCRRSCRSARPGMTPYEIMLSESQERMLLVVKKGREAEVERIFEKWDLHAVRIGEVTTDGRMRVKNRGEVVAEIPNGALTDEAPVYRRPMAEPAYLEEAQQLSLGVARQRPASPSVVLKRLLASPAIASKRWVYRQYDHMVRDEHAGAAGHGRRRRPGQGNDARAGALGRLQRAVRLSRSVRRGAARGGRSVAQRRLCRRAADRRDQLPELRQPAAARDHVAVRARGRRHGRGVPRARHPDHRRQCQPLQRDRRAGRAAHAGARRRRPDRGRGPGRAAAVPAGRRRGDSAR